MLGGKLARVLRGKQAGTARVAGEGRQSVTAGNKESSGCSALAAPRCFWQIFLLGQGLRGAEVPTPQTGTLHLLPSGLQINCCFLGSCCARLRAN